MPSRDDAETNIRSYDAGRSPRTHDTDYVTTFDPASERASEAVVTAVAALTDTDPTDLAPLYDVVEPDAVDSLCDHAQWVGDDDIVHRLWFPYEGFDVCVRSDGRIRVLETPTTAGSNLEHS